MASITYRQVNDYIIPNLTLPPEESNIILGKWGMLHKDYLLKNKKVVFANLISEGKLWQYIAEIDTQAQQMFDALVEQIKETEGVTEQLKEQDQFEWVHRMGNIQQRANDIVCSELIYT